MKATNIYIIRHAETIGNIEERLTGRCDYDITENGMKSIGILTDKLKDVKFDVAYSSTEERTHKTIEQIAKRNGIEVHKVHELSEMFFGDYDGYKWEDVNKIDPKIKQLQNEINVISGIPNQESMEEVADRMYNFILKCCLNNIGKNILIGSHGVAIEAFLRKITNVPFRYEREKYTQHNVAINKVVFNNNEFKIEILANNTYTENSK